MTGISVIVLASSVCEVPDLTSAASFFKSNGGPFERLLQYPDHVPGVASTIKCRSGSRK